MVMTLGEENIVEESIVKTAAHLNTTYRTLYAQGRYADAVAPAKQLRWLILFASGSKSPDYAEILDNLAVLYVKTGNYKAAEPLFREALDIERTVYGEQHPDYAITLSNLAMLYQDVGNYKAAEPLYRKTRDIMCVTQGERSLMHGHALNSLAGLYIKMDNKAAAEPLLKDALDIYRETVGEQHPDYARILHFLGSLYSDIAKYQAAEQLLLKARDVQRIELGKKHPEYASTLDSLALLYVKTGNYKAAEPLFREALDIERTVYGEQHPVYARALNNFTMLYRSMANYKAAELLAHKATDIFRKTRGNQHPDYAASLNNLAGLYRDMGNYKAAEPLYREAVSIVRVALGEYHPTYAGYLRNLAYLFAATNHIAEALDAMKQAESISDHTIAEILSAGSESQRLIYLQSIRYSAHLFLSLLSQLCPSSKRASNKAMDLVQRRKGIGAEALAAQRDAVLGGKYPALRERLERLYTLKSEIIRKTFAGPGTESVDKYRQHLGELNEQREQLEAALAHQIPEMRLEQQLKAVDYQAIARRLPEGTALVEFVRFYTHNFTAVPARGERELGLPHYLAFVLRAQEPDSLVMLDLGSAKHIDRMIIDFRASIIPEAQVRSNDVVTDEQIIEGTVSPGTTLRAHVFDPLVLHLGGYTSLLIAPDGELTRLPFEALPTDDGRRLIDDYHISYLSVGRDVLRFSHEVIHKPAASMVIADPDFDLSAIVPVDSNSLTGNRKSLLSKLGFRRHKHDTINPLMTCDAHPQAQDASAPTASRHSRDFIWPQPKVSRLPATAAEGEQILAIFRSAKLQSSARFQQDALVQPVKATRSPYILHLATHGFFLKNQKLNTRRRFKRSGSADQMFDRITAAGIENPLLRSGLLLAGINTWLKGGSVPSEAGDGILTAEEVSGMDLTDTDLVVLSACQTGLGEVKTGEGVFGLRRAFMLAGAKTLVMSLWKVDDEATKELMVDFYDRILDGEGRADALRNAQLAIKEKYPDPYYWGAFITQGNPGPLIRFHTDNL
ncbi:MAG: CHAT domain-containing protein [Halobacteriota archaeon]